MTKLSLPTLAAFALFFGSGCGAADSVNSSPGGGNGGGGGGQNGGPLDLPLQNDPISFEMETVAGGLDTPWAMEFASNGDLYFTERPGRVSMISKGNGAPKLIATIADSTETGGEGGLMGLALHPDFASNGWLYLAYNSRDEYGIKVQRYTVRDGGLHEAKLILDGIGGGANHDGCALRFGPDGKLYLCTGERYEKDLSQKMDSLNGKTLRVNDDGSVPEDNPFVGREGARPEIWSIGHRNAQALAFAPGTGRQVQAEHGPSGSDAPGGGDEVNIIEKGANYGWPLVHHRETRDGMTPPVLEYTLAIAPAGADFYRGTLFAGWEGDFLFTNLRGSCVVRVDFEDGKVIGHSKFLTGLGRLRAIAVAPDGSIYVGTSNHDGRGRPAENDDRIMRLTPK